jgi:hypothetical protein
MTLANFGVSGGALGKLHSGKFDFPFDFPGDWFQALEDWGSLPHPLHKFCPQWLRRVFSHARTSD